MADMLHENGSLDGTQKAISGVPMEFRPRGLTDVKKQVKSIRWMVILATFSLVILTATNLGMVVAGVYLTRQFTLKEYPDGTIHLAKKGTNQIVHVSQSRHEHLPLNSGMSDDYFKKLDSVTLSFDGTNSGAHASARRTMASLRSTKHTIHAKVEGFQRLPCEDCFSKTQVKLTTQYGNYVLRDHIMIPLLKKDHFTNLNTHQFTLDAARSQGLHMDLFKKWNSASVASTESSTTTSAASGGGGGFTSRSLQGLFDGENHGSWDATFDQNTGSNASNGSSQGVFSGNFHESWKSEGGSSTDLGSQVHYDTASHSGTATIGIKHEW